MAGLTPIDKALLLLRRAVPPTNATADPSASPLLENIQNPQTTDLSASSTGSSSLPTTFSSPAAPSSPAPLLSSAKALSLVSRTAMSSASPSTSALDPLLLQTSTASTVSSSELSEFSSASLALSSFAESSSFSSATPSSLEASSSEFSASLLLSLSQVLLAQFSSSAFLLAITSSSIASSSSAAPSSSFPSFSSSLASSTLSSSSQARSTLQPSSTSSSLTSLRSSSQATLHTSSFVPFTSTLSVSPDTTITTLITVPTAAQADTSNSDSHQTTAQKNSKLIGGLVGSIGGTIVIGSLVVLFLFLKKRKQSSYTNQSPDFNDDTSGEDGYNDKFGFRKLLGSKNTANTLGAGTAATDFERNTRGVHPGPFVEPADDDFQYRGVTNSNNLDSIFRSTATNSTGPNSGQASARVGHSRYGSVANPMSTMPENRGYYDSTNEYSSGGAADTFGHSREHSDDTEGGFHPSDYEIYDEELPLPRVHRPSDVFGTEVHSNNLRSRFTEEI